MHPKPATQAISGVHGPCTTHVDSSRSRCGNMTRWCAGRLFLPDHRDKGGPGLGLRLLHAAAIDSRILVDGRISPFRGDHSPSHQVTKLINRGEGYVDQNIANWNRIGEWLTPVGNIRSSPKLDCGSILRPKRVFQC